MSTLSTSLKQIAIPDYSRTDFGRALAEQFANININFQKLGNIDLGRGEDGLPCIYLTYNLNSIFVYSTVTSENGGEYVRWKEFNQGINDKATESLREVYKKMAEDVEADYQAFNKVTHQSREEYASMCAYLLFGKSIAYIPDDNYPTSSSLTGAVWVSQSPNLMNEVSITDNENQTRIYRAVWLRDWYLAKEIDDKISIYNNHIHNFDPGKITLACTPSKEEPWLNLGGYKPTGSLAYIFIDPRFRNNQIGSLLNANMDQMEDASCVVYWEPEYSDNQPLAGRFKSAQLFPQIYFSGGGFYWKINGKETGIPVTGTPGEPGKNSQFVVVERVENIIGASKSHLQGDGDLKGGVCAPSMANETITNSSYSGRVSRQTYTGDMEEDIPGVSVNTKTLGGKVLTQDYEITPAGTWELTGYPDENNTEVNHCFRILKVVGKECFFKYEGTPIEDSYRPYDPVFARYNFGKDKDGNWNDNAVQVSDSISIQNLISTLDGCPCIVIPGPSFSPSLVGSTVWFSTLKAVRVENNSSSRLQLIAYCGPENQFVMKLDDHAFANSMQNLDTYTYHKTGDRHHHARGLMLPIGSSRISSSDNDPDIWAAHIIHSDLGGFDDINEIDGYLYGIQKGLKFKDAKDNNAENNTSTVGSYLVSGVDGESNALGCQSQFLEVFKKRVLHVGSVEDYRSLDYVPLFKDSDNHFNAAVPGRQTKKTKKKDEKSEKEWSTPYSAQYYKGSELHVDEPVTITSYRDLFEVKHLLNVEGDVTIGLLHHVNAIKQDHTRGGLYIGSTLSGDTLWDNKNQRSLFEGTPITPYNQKDKIDNGIQPIYSKSFISANIKNKNGFAEKVKPGLLVKEMIGARVLLVSEGLAVLKDTDSENATFSVDSSGNIQTQGNEIRSNNPDTLWVFHDQNEDYFGLKAENKSHTRWGYHDIQDGADGEWLGLGSQKTITIQADYTNLAGNEYVTGYSKIDGKYDKNLDLPTGSNLVLGDANKLGYTIGNQKSKPGLQVTHGLYIENPIASNSSNYLYKAIQKSLTFSAPGNDPIGDSVGGFWDYWTVKNIYTHPGLWVNDGVFIGQNLLVNQDAHIGNNVLVGADLKVSNNIQVFGAAHIGKQIRAASFRRRRSSRERGNKNQSVALMFDNGWSSVDSPYYDMGSDQNITLKTPKGGSQNDVDSSPIILDLGSGYGKDRLIRFGVAKGISLADDTGKNVNIIPADSSSAEDNSLCLIGQLPNKLPVISVYPSSSEIDDWDNCNSLFDLSWDLNNSKNRSNNVNPIRVWGHVDNGKATVWVQILLNDQMVSKPIRSDCMRVYGFGIRILQPAPTSFRTTTDGTSLSLISNEYDLKNKVLKYKRVGDVYKIVCKKYEKQPSGSILTSDQFENLPDIDYFTANELALGFENQTLNNSFCYNEILSDDYVWMNYNGQRLIVDSSMTRMIDLCNQYTNVFLDDGLSNENRDNYPKEDKKNGYYKTNVPIYWRQQSGYKLCYLDDKNNPNWIYGTDFPLGEYWARYDDESRKMFMGVDSIYNLVNSAQKKSIVCTGFNWNKHLGPGFPKPLFDITVFIPGLTSSGSCPLFTSSNIENLSNDFFKINKIGSHYAYTLNANPNTKINLQPIGREETGIKFKLNTDGYLVIDDAISPGMLTIRTDQVLTLQFNYLCDTSFKPSYYATNMALYKMNNESKTPWERDVDEGGEWVYFSNNTVNIPKYYKNRPNDTTLNEGRVNNIDGGWNFLWEATPGDLKMKLIKKRWVDGGILDPVSGTKLKNVNEAQLTCGLIFCAGINTDPNFGSFPVVGIDPYQALYIWDGETATGGGGSSDKYSKGHYSIPALDNYITITEETMQNSINEIMKKNKYKNLFHDGVTTTSRLNKSDWTNAKNWLNSYSFNGTYTYSNLQPWVVRKLVAFACKHSLKSDQVPDSNIPAITGDFVSEAVLLAYESTFLTSSDVDIKFHEKKYCDHHLFLTFTKPLSSMGLDDTHLEQLYVRKNWSIFRDYSFYSNMDSRYARNCTTLYIGTTKRASDRPDGEKDKDIDKPDENNNNPNSSSSSGGGGGTWSEGWNTSGGVDNAPGYNPNPDNRKPSQTIGGTGGGGTRPF